jgi:hypothetical protein
MLAGNGWLSSFGIITSMYAAASSEAMRANEEELERLATTGE